jgi:hypothetical protein
MWWWGGTEMLTSKLQLVKHPRLVLIEVVEAGLKLFHLLLGDVGGISGENLVSQ